MRRGKNKGLGRDGGRVEDATSGGEGRAAMRWGWGTGREG